MAFRPNYNQQRGDRTRAKERKKAEKLQRRDEETQRRKIDRGELPEVAPDADVTVPDSAPVDTSTPEST